MLRLKTFSGFIIWMAGFLLIMGLTACAPESALVETPAVEPVIETAVPAATEVLITPAPTDTTPTVLLVSGTDTDPFLWSETQSLLESLAGGSSLRLVILDGLTPESITAEVEVVVGVGQYLELNTLAASAPDVSFVAIADPSAIVAENLSVIGDPIIEARQQAFMAGYLSAVISTDNKVAALIPDENAARDLLAESFVVGARFFCGLCQPLYPPYNPFPQWASLSSSAQEDVFRPAVNQFSSIGVEIMYVHGDLISPELLAYLDELGMKVVSDRAPDIQRSNWVGTITADPAPALEALWPALLSAEPGKRMPSAIVLADRQMGLVSEGRYRLFEAMVAELQAGLVSVEITP
jgi:hypothetical protein